jgi:hypothetical protein
MRIKKKDLKEAKYIVDKDSVKDFEDDMGDKVEDEDVVKVVDLQETEEELQESVKPIIRKKDLINLIKEHKKNAKV